MKERLIELLYGTDTLTHAFPEEVEMIAEHLLNNGVTIPPITCKHCTFYEPFEKVEDFDGRCCLLNGTEVDNDFYCKWGAKK